MIPFARRRRRYQDFRKLAPRVPASVLVQVTSVVAQDGGAMMTFSGPVALNELGPGETIRFDDGVHSGFAEDLSQAAPDAIFVNAVPGVMLAAGATWSIVGVPPCFELAADEIFVVPQSGTVE